MLSSSKNRAHIYLSRICSQMLKISRSLVDLPDEMLICILNKLENVDVLLSFCGINNHRLKRLINDKIFSDRLTFPSDIDRTKTILRRFCDSMWLSTRQFCTLFHRWFTIETDFQRTNCEIRDCQWISWIFGWIEYTNIVYVHLAHLFDKLEYFNVIHDNREIPLFTLVFLSSTCFSCANLRHLSVNVGRFDDILCLLDGRVNQLTTLIVQIDSMNVDSTRTFNNVRPLFSLFRSISNKSLFRRLCNSINGCSIYNN